MVPSVLILDKLLLYLSILLILCEHVLQVVLDVAHFRILDQVMFILPLSILNLINLLGELVALIHLRMDGR